MSKKMDSKSLEKRLSGVKESSEDIQALSRWCIQHKNHHHSIVQAWSRAVRKAKVGHRLTLFYVCNDIVQNARRKKYTNLVQFFGTAVKEAAPLVRDDKIKQKIIRIFKIWEERGIYDAKLVADITELIENVGTVNATENDTVIASFQLPKLEEGIRNIIFLEDSSNSLLTDLKSQEGTLSEDYISKLQTTVKERGSGGERLEDFEDSVVGLECYISALQKEIEERTRLVTLLEQAEIFYETQRGEAKLVANAYKNFSSQVISLNAKLAEIKKKLPSQESPMPSPPSPCADAPSPTPSDEDIAIIDSQNEDGFKSFLDSGSNIASMVQSVFQDNEKDRKSPTTSLTEKLSSYRDRNYEPKTEHRSERLNSESIKERSRSPPKPFKSYTSAMVSDAKPMSARELFDTFGNSYNSKKTSYTAETTAPYIPTATAPFVPEVPTRVNELMDAIPLPPAKENFMPPFQPSWPPPVWNQPPPPPPPPPPIPPPTMPPPSQDVYPPSEWNQFDNYEELDDETDNRNWGEVPGAEELEALSVQPSSIAVSKTDSFYPSNSLSPTDYDDGKSESSSSNRQQNLVSIEPKMPPMGEDSVNYPCNDYRRLTQDRSNDKTKKRSHRNPDSSGSDMDISDSDSTGGGSKRGKRNKRSGFALQDSMSDHRPRTIIPLTNNEPPNKGPHSNPSTLNEISERSYSESFRDFSGSSVTVDTRAISEALKHLQEFTAPSPVAMSITNKVNPISNEIQRNSPENGNGGDFVPRDDYESHHQKHYDYHHGNEKLLSPSEQYPPINEQYSPPLDDSTHDDYIESPRNGHNLFSAPPPMYNQENWSRGGSPFATGPRSHGPFRGSRGGDKPRRGFISPNRGYNRGWNRGFDPSRGGNRGSRGPSPFRRPARW